MTVGKLKKNGDLDILGENLIILVIIGLIEINHIKT
jgi:hypothetical protein